MISATETYTPSQLVDMMLTASRDLDQAHVELERRVHEKAESEHVYRLAKSNAYLATSGTVGEREAYVYKTVAEERKRAKLAADLSQSALEAVRSKRSQLTALQSIANSIREEARLARSGPDGGF